MKLFYWVSFIFLMNSYQAITAQQVFSNNFENDISCSEQKCANINLKNLQSLDYGFDISYERIFLNVNPNTLFLQGNIGFYFKSKMNNLDTLIFDFSDSLKIDSVIFHQTQVAYTKTNDLLKVLLSVSLNFNQSDSVCIYYHGIPDTLNGGSAISRSFHGASNIPIIATLSEPYGAKYWMPCKQNLNDKIDSMDFYIQHPQGYRAASNGILFGIDTVGSEIKTHWKHRYPIDYYLIAFVVTNYEDFTFYHHNNFNNDSIPIVNYIYPENISDTTNILIINDVLNLYDSLFIPYPFSLEKYGHAQFNWLGGMEHQTMSFVYNFSFELMAHEFAHQWFGDYITLASWHDIWLNEGFATYLVGLCYEHLFNGSWWPLWKDLQVNAITQQPDGSVYCDDTTSVNRIFDSRLSYKKGAYVLHMLRWILGDSVFFQGIRNYLNDMSLEYGTAFTSDLKYHLENVGDTSLTEFFNDWYSGQGYPYYNISWSQEQDTIHFLFDQMPSDNSVSFFEMKVPLQLYYQGLDTILIFNNQMNHQRFNIPFNTQVDSIVFDPDKWLIAEDTIVNTTNIDLQKEGSIDIYPNPAKTRLNISLLNNNVVKRISILNLNGQQIYSTSEKKSNYTMDVLKFNDGIYILKIVTNQQVYIKKLEIIK